MVKFIGGPSINAYKNYSNHRIAREGQFRMPRNYGSVTNKTTIIVRNNNQCNCAAPRMNWLAMIPMFGSLLAGIMDLFKRPTPTPTPTPTPKEPDVKTDEVVTTEEAPDNNETPDPEVKTEIEEKTTQETTTEEKVTTTEIKDEEMDRILVTGNDCKLNPSSNQKEYIAPLWNTVASSYKDGNGNPIPNTKEFRNWFRETILGNKNADIYDLGKDQHFPNEITFKGITYTFNGEHFKNKANWDHYLVDNDGDKANYADMAQKKETQETQKNTTTWSGTTTFKFDANKDGDYDDEGDINKTWTTNNATSKDAAIADLTKQIQNSELTDNHKKLAFGNLTNATLNKRNNKEN